MANKGKKSKLGHDPLSWICEEDAVVIQQENSHQEKIKEEIKEENTENIEIVEETITENIIHETVSEESITQLDNSEMKEIKMLDLPLYFGIAQVAEVYAQMQELLVLETECIKIQAEDIESIDASAIQLLVVFVKTATNKGKKIEWQGVSDKLHDAVLVFQLNDQLDMAA